MSELPETTTTSAPPEAPAEPKPYWLYRFAAWVGIVAGIVFIAATVFFSGAKLTHHGGWHGHHHHHHHHSMMHRGPHHHHGHGPMAPGSEAPGLSEVPPSANPAPPPPGR